MMKTVSASALVLILLQTSARSADDEKLRKDIVGTWVNTTGGQAERGQRQIKLVTPNHFAWVVFDLKTKTTSAVEGGSWTIHDGKYREKVEFAAESHEFLIGKEFPFSIAIDGDTWSHKAEPGAGVAVDEVWKRVK
jgi:hypothetical protein